MPRQSPAVYLTQLLILRRLWDLGPPAFSLLSLRQQRDLHDFYQPSLALTDQEAVDHRARITKLDPSLPQRAGKAYRRLERMLQIPDPSSGRFPHPHKHHPLHTASGRDLVAHTVLRPQPDVKLLARALYRMAEQMGIDNATDLKPQPEKHRRDQDPTPGEGPPQAASP